MERAHPDIEMATLNGWNTVEPGSPVDTSRDTNQVLTELYDRYGEMLYRLAYRLTGSAEDAEDVVQDVFVGLPEALRKHTEQGKMDGWIRTVTARMTPALSELNLQLIACQPLGSLEIRQSSESFASAAVVGGSGGEQLETLPNGFRVHNSPSSEATYRVWVPRRIRSVRVELGSGPAVHTFDNSLAGVWWTLHLQSDLADGDNCIEG